MAGAKLLFNLHKPLVWSESDQVAKKRLPSAWLACVILDDFLSCKPSEIMMPLVNPINRR